MKVATYRITKIKGEFSSQQKPWTNKNLDKHCGYCGHLWSKHAKVYTSGYETIDFWEWECWIENCECSDDCNPLEKKREKKWN